MLKHLTTGIFIAFVFFSIVQKVDAAVLLQRPLYIGLTNGLVGYWSFNDPDMAGTRAFDRSGQANNGTLMNGPQRVAGKIGQGLSFDGVYSGLLCLDSICG